MQLYMCVSTWCIGSLSLFFDPIHYTFESSKTRDNNFNFFRFPSSHLEAKYQVGRMIGVGNKGVLYKGVMIDMIVSLKKIQFCYKSSTRSKD